MYNTSIVSAFINCRLQIGHFLRLSGVKQTSLRLRTIVESLAIETMSSHTSCSAPIEISVFEDDFGV